jgi:hypothetical protein
LVLFSILNSGFTFFRRFLFSISKLRSDFDLYLHIILFLSRRAIDSYMYYLRR